MSNKISPPILPPATLGMLGGGQLGRFFVVAAHEMGYKVAVLDPDLNSPAGAIADQHIVAAYDDMAALDTLSQTCAAVTTEFENVPADTLAYLAKFVPVRPDATCVATAQNRIKEKTFLREHHIPHAPFAEIHSEADIDQAAGELFPGILKVVRFGYDGKGQTRVKNVAEAKAAFRQSKGETCVLEKMLSLDYEISVVLTRGADGKIACFPPAENLHTNGILDVSAVPATGSEALISQAEILAAQIAEKMNYIGVLGVEFFVVNGELFANELAPRPHNSGHYTIDACVTNQFEQQVRALCGLPLGDARAHSAAVMVNLLGGLWYLNDKHRSDEPMWDELFNVPNLKLHLYGKQEARIGRKMGHFTVIGSNPAEVRAAALSARAAIGIADSE
ncbi:MAG TPA: 5-(carboxyamino)imidazole ribonucleotide synthase [Rhodocyclaceae bacterium]|nr:5-(carboxyamino)imidazole ribonucleotide synthase [Rhodocyclaceae bacterium]